MNKIFAKNLFCLILISLCFNPKAQDHNIKKRINDYLESKVEQGLFSGNVLVSVKEEIIFSKSYAYANLEWQVKNNSKTVFRIGSLTKQFTAAAILLLEQRGLLSVDDFLSKYLPDFPNGDKISIHNLLTHTAGIVSVTNPGILKSNKEILSIDQVIDTFKKLPFEFEPGTTFKYSNSGYVLLAKVIEISSGLSYKDFMKANIFLPLGMTSTKCDDNMLIMPFRATGYSRKGRNLQNAEYIYMGIPVGGGSIVSTIEDLYTWDRALRTNRLLLEKTKKRMFTPFLNSYAYGWGIREISGEIATTHTGGINGFSSNIMRFPESNVCLIILSNYEFASSGQLNKDLSEIIFD
ncbi:MAG: serine hydrolase domain-containing protein [Cyclobacteriaceae bacterium]